MSGDLVWIHVQIGIRYTPQGPVVPFGMVRANPDPASDFVRAILSEYDRGDPPSDTQVLNNLGTM